MKNPAPAAAGNGARAAESLGGDDVVLLPHAGASAQRRLLALHADTAAGPSLSAALLSSLADLARSLARPVRQGWLPHSHADVALLLAADRAGVAEAAGWLSRIMRREALQ
jgi:hypothetical protein